MATLAAGMVDALQNQASELAGQQKDLAEDTSNAKDGEGENLKDRQEGLNESVDDLLEQIDRTARSMGDFNENATEDLLSKEIQGMRV